MQKTITHCYDYCIVGAGFSGLVMAERLTTAGKNVIIVEKRSHIGGNCYDTIDMNGVLYHAYGPHYFRTNSDEVQHYLSAFTTWLPVSYRIKVHAEGQLWSFPVNLLTFEQYLGRPSNSSEFAAWLESQRISFSHCRNSEEVVLSQVGREFYELFFEDYTCKQWNLHPRELAPEVCGRIPMCLNRDERYFSDSFQAMPRDGYTAMFKRMLAACGDSATLVLNTDFEEIDKHIYHRLIYTGPIDAYFHCILGPLPWRSLRFDLQTLRGEQLPYCTNPHARPDIPGFWQSTVQVNYAHQYNYTRTVEIKHITGQQTPHTNVVTEYPCDYGPDRDPCYPIPGAETAKLYKRYAELAYQEKDVSFTGRLATYRYLNMDQVVAEALHLAKQLLEQ